ncbi:MAG: SPFH domain-containing protein [Planctomycetota bacterium]|jgi:membrane protease subunit HflC
MRKHIGIIVLAALVLLALLTYMTTYAVSSTEMTLVTTVGKVDPDTVFDGRDPKQAGLKFKWPYPFQQLIRYDARIFQFEDNDSEVQTHDETKIRLTMFCQWRVADPVTFYGSAETVEKAESDLRDRLQAIEGDVVGRHDMADFINTDPQRMQLAQIEEDVADLLRAQTEDAYGVRIETVGVKSLALPESVTKTVINEMKAARQSEAKTYQQQGASKARGIRSRAESAKDTILAFARLKAENIRTEGYREAAEKYRDYAEHPEFAMYLRSLESLRKELESRTVIILDGSKIPAVEYFREGPSLPTGVPGQEAPTR